VEANVVKASPESQQQPAVRTYWQEVRRRFFRHRLAVLGLAIVLLELALVLAAAHIAPDPYRPDPLAFRAAPSAAHKLGTDALGRDVWARLLHGGRVSLSVGLISTAISAAIGTPIGLLTGYRRGAIDTFFMRLADTFMSVPSIMLILTLVAVIGPSIWSVMAVIGVLGWPHFARLARGSVLRLREMEFVAAAQAIGASDRAVMFRHLLPNAMAPLLVAATFRMSQAILLEASLSFLGMGVQPPQASWGNMLYDAQSITVLSNMPWIWVPPGVAIVITVLAINFIGDGLRDALDPQMKLS